MPYLPASNPAVAREIIIGVAAFFGHFVQDGVGIRVFTLARLVGLIIHELRRLVKVKKIKGINSVPVQKIITPFATKFCPGGYSKYAWKSSTFAGWCTLYT